MKKTHLISIILMTLVYVCVSLIVNKPYIIPRIEDILVSLFKIVISKNFLLTIFTTLSRSFLGIIIAFILAILLSLLSYFNKTIKELLQPAYILFKTIPNITYIIIALLWLGRDGSVILVSFLVVFPILYNSILHSLLSIDDALISYTKTINGSILYKIKRIYLPLIKNDILNALNNACSLGFKVSIMAEILSQTRSGIGKELYFAKANYQMPDIFAWTIIIIILSYLIDLLLNKIKAR